jgi:hypothetical protein
MSALIRALVVPYLKKKLGMRVRAWEEGLRDVNRALSQPRKAFMTAYRWIMYIYKEKRGTCEGG